MKKAAFLLVLLSVILSANIVFADTVPFLSFYTVSGNNETAAKHEFNLGETPWLYVSLPNPGAGISTFTSTIGTDWKLGAVLKDSENRMNKLDQLRFWLTPANWSSGPSPIQEAGHWYITGSFNITDRTFDHAAFGKIVKDGAGSTDFTVKTNTVPEPVSTLLFLLGGATLVLRRRLRK